MNKRERVRQIMELKDEIVNFDKHRNKVAEHGDGFKHMIVKTAVFKVLSDAGHEVVTEAEFKDGTVADVLDADTRIVYEIQGDTSVDKTSPYMDKDFVEDVIVLDLGEVKGVYMDVLKEWVEKEVVV